MGRAHSCRRRLWGPWQRAFATIIGLILTLGVVPVSSTEIEALLPEHLKVAMVVGDDLCLECHSEIGEVFATGLHGQVATHELPNGVVTGCESCHGPGSLHAETNAPEDIVAAGADASLASRLCVQCHRTAEYTMFEGSVHGMSDVACGTCHVIHGEQRQSLLQKGALEVCRSCHEDVVARLSMPSHHPLREGLMTCFDCHAPHYDGYRGLTASDSPNDLCFACHSDKQGPFVFEHSPVIEDCATCHDSHGSIANNLLTSNEPFLCLQCHQAHFHATLDGSIGDFESIDGYAGMSHSQSAKRAFMTKCTQCHTEIHGSDFPSQSISGGGKALTR